MDFEPLVTLDRSGDKLYVCGAENETRSDGTGSFMVAQVFISDHDFVENEVLVDEVGERWVLRSPAESGFHLTGIVLERKEDV